jgi:ABC-type amino acid transport substrate-binding protein
MKKIIAIVLLLALVACSLVACKKDEPTPETPAVPEYKLAVVVDEGLATLSRGGATVIALALVWDAEGKIVAARFDSVQPTFALNEDKTDIVAVDRVTTKVELGDEYNKMPGGTWENQAKAFENYIVGMTAAQVAALDTSNVGPENPIVAGCTMSSTTPVFQALVAEAFAYERAVSFSTSETVTLGLAINCAVSGSVAAGGKIAGDVAGVAVAGGKVVASMIDSMEGKYTLAIGEDQKLTVTLKEYKGTKNEQGDAYGMVENSDPQAIAEWYAQAQAFANATVGKTVAELDAIDATAVAGCTMYAGGYKAALVRAAGYVR